MTDYNEIYQQCLDETYQDDTLKPVLSTIYKIVNYYDDKITLIFDDKDITRFINDLFDITKYIVENCDYQDFDEIVDFILKTNPLWQNFKEELEAIYCSNNSFERNRCVYYYIYLGFCKGAKYMDYNAFSFDLFKYINVFRDYYHVISNNNDPSCSFFFQKYGAMILSLFYKDKVSVDHLYKAFDYILNNYRVLSAFHEHNTVNGLYDELYNACEFYSILNDHRDLSAFHRTKDELDDCIISMILDNYQSNKSPVIKD